jgi:hypothetical protein
MSHFPSGEPLHVIRKACGQEIHITRYRYKEHSTIDVRVYNLKQDGTVTPTKQGVRALESVWAEVISAMKQLPLVPQLPPEQ